VGTGSLTSSLAVCLLNAGHTVILWTNDDTGSKNAILAHISEINFENDVFKKGLLKVCGEDFPVIENCRMAIVITKEDLAIKRDLIRQLEDKLLPEVIIGINSETICLDVLQQDTKNPERIIGLNWAEPAHTTMFLEIISNPAVNKKIMEHVLNIAKIVWKKDPYVVQNFGLRSRLIGAMAREAFYLVEHDYASVEDIDRACRNDAGYYLSFAGNCRYMDLMGTYAYGMVMKDLNPDLCKDRHLSDFFLNIIKEGGLGMENGKGFYQYTKEEIDLWRNIACTFSYQIEKIINKYPFNYKEINSVL
jgi:3-hydroxybutyryl-CoA dehydrogenase